MSINVSNVELLLVEQISNATNSLDLLQYTKSLEMLKAGYVTTVLTFGNLPSVSTVATGSLYFVESDRLMYIATPNSWTRLLPVYSSWAWGRNFCGLQGTDVWIHSSSCMPNIVISRFTDQCQVSAGSFHTAAVRTNGTIWASGANSSGQLGDNSATYKTSPVSVVGGFTDWCQVSAGGYHTAAVRTNGTIWAWGTNSSGQLGDNTAVTRSSPVSVVGGFTDWCQVSAGGNHTAAIRTNGTLWAWGTNSSGQLGDNTTVSRSSPVGVVGGFTDWCQVSAGHYHTAAIRTNGTLWAWGTNNTGQLGDNTTVSRPSPVGVAGGFTNWCQVSAGRFHTAAVRTNGTIWTWGWNPYGQLGNNTTTSSSSPVGVVGGFTDWCQVSAGCTHTAAVRTNGTIWTWGRNSCGKLGDNTTADRSSPVSVVGGFTDWFQVSANACGTVAIRAYK